MAGLAFHFHEPVVVFDESVDHGETQPRAAARLFGGEERLEDPGQGFGCDSRPGVLDGNTDILSRGTSRSKVERRRSQGDGAHLEGQRPPLRHRVTGVDAHIQQGLFKVTRLRVHPQRLASLVDDNVDVSIERPRHHAPHTVQNVVDAHRLYLLPLRTGKAQELARQLRGALGRLLDHAHGILQRIIRTQPLASQ